MNSWLKKYSDNGVITEISGFGSQNKTREFQMMLHVSLAVGCFSRQLQNICRVLANLSEDPSLSGAEPVFARCFLSDAANQYAQAEEAIAGIVHCPVSYVQQPPLDGSKLAIWLQMQTDVALPVGFSEGFEHNGYTHFYTVSDSKFFEKADTSYLQTHILLREYEHQLAQYECTIEKNCLRTWFFARDIDVDYHGIVVARKENFLKNALTNDTHYIASTGIQGGGAGYHTKVLMDAYAIKGLEEDQIRYLYATENMSRTYDYGVTFERGVSIDFGDRRKILISGTASIDSKGVVMYVGDIEKQVLRMWDNVEALLREAASGFEDLMQIIVYLRDISDYQHVRHLFDEKFPSVPKVIVLAPICRPGWLVEMECIAVKNIDNCRYRNL